MKSKGFSLIELIVVLIVISLSISLVTPSLSRFSKTIELKSTAKKVSGILRYCRSEAVNKGLVYQVVFNSELREVKVQSMEWKKIYSLPEGIHIREIEVASSQYPSDLPTIEFYPNGGSNGGFMVFDRQGHKGYRIEVHFLTGMVKIEEV